MLFGFIYESNSIFFVSEYS